MKDKFTITDYYFFLFFLFLSVLVINSGGGPDHTHYLLWSEYFLTFNLDTFSDYPKSINGLPLVLWYYGIGLITSVLSKIFFLKGILAMKISSALLTIINFSLFYKISKHYEISKFSFLFLISLAYLMLPAGFYFNKYSAETWTVFLTLLSIFLIEHDIKNLKDLKIGTLTIFGIILYFLILVKITNVFLAVALLLIFYVKKFNKTLINKKNFHKNLKILFFGSFFILFAIIMLGIYHKLLNGSFYDSPYSYGNNEFSFFSITNFKLREVLFSSWHGMLFYHPFFILSFLFMLIIFNKKNYKEDNIKWILLITSIFFLIRLIIQSSQQVWWAGMGTYGSRGFVGISILIFYALLHINKYFKDIKLNIFLKFLVLSLLVHQTYLLSMGETNFFNYSNYFAFFISKDSLILFSLILILLTSIFTYKKFYNFNFTESLRIAVILMALFASIAIIFFTHKNPYLMIFMAILFSYFFSYSIQTYATKVRKIVSSHIHKVIATIFVLLFVFSIFSQIILFSQYQKNIKPNFISGKNFSCTNAVGGFMEFNHLPNYDDLKMKWLYFLKSSGCL